MSHINPIVCVGHIRFFKPFEIADCSFEIIAHKSTPYYFVRDGSIIGSKKIQFIENGSGLCEEL